MPYSHAQENTRHYPELTRWEQDKTGTGAIILARDTGRILLSQRWCGHWATIGGLVDPGETIPEGRDRELIEEIGQVPDIIGSQLLHRFYCPLKNFRYYTYAMLVAREFTPDPQASHAYENQAYEWFHSDQLPQKLHFGLKDILDTPVAHTHYKAAIKNATPVMAPR